MQSCEQVMGPMATPMVTNSTMSMACHLSTSYSLYRLVTSAMKMRRAAKSVRMPMRKVSRQP